MESSTPSQGNEPVIELSIEFAVELLLCLYPFGAEQMGLPHNFWVGLISWVIGTAIAIRMFWIFPAWSHRLSRLEKGLIAFIGTAFLMAVFYRPIAAAYKRRNGEVLSLPAAPVSTPAHPIGPSTPETARGNQRGAARKRTGPDVGDHRTRIQGSVKQGGDNSPCQANAIGGNAKVEDCNAGPPEAKVSWKVKDMHNAQALPGNATVVIELTVDQTLDYPAFYATCDRPCHVTFAGANGWTGTEGILRKRPTETGVILSAPRPLGPGVPVDMFIAADDSSTPTIVAVGKVSRADVPTKQP